MRKFNNKSGFTLIEIIVVLIIIGILAAIALPNIFSNVQKSKGAQAIAVMDSYKTQMEGCLAQWSETVPNEGNCTLTNLNLLTTAGNWSFSVSALVPQGSKQGTSVLPEGYASDVPGDLTYTFQAIDGSSNTITLTRYTSGTWACSTGSGNPYTGIC